jgi:hypothetical protein
MGEIQDEEFFGFIRFVRLAAVGCVNCFDPEVGRNSPVTRLFRRRFKADHNNGNLYRYALR